MWILIITEMWVQGSGIMMNTRDEFPFDNQQECLEAAARHNETFQRVRLENQSGSPYLVAQCVKDWRKQEAP